MIGPDWMPYPWLAKNWEISKDVRTYTFHLWENITFSDGVPLTSEDVKFTWDGWKKQNVTQQRSKWENVDYIETPDPYTVVFHLKKSDGSFIESAISHFTSMVVPKHIWKNIENWNTFVNDDPKLAIGSGPFKLKEWKKGEYIRLEVNKNYWWGRAYADELIWVVVGMRDMQLMALEKGEIDMMYINANEIPKFLDPHKFFIYQVLDPGLPHWFPNHARRPGNDIAFRRAMEYMVDRNKIINLAHFGYGAIPSHILPPSYEGGGWLPPDTWTKPFNLTKAAKLLDEAGYIDVDKDGWREHPNGDKMKLDMVVSTAEAYVKSAEVIVESMQRIGINVKLGVYEGPTVTAKMTSKDFDFGYSRWGPGGGDPIEPLNWYSSLGMGSMYAGWSNATFDKKLAEAKTLVDYKDKRAAIWELQRIMEENVAFVPHVTQFYIKVVRSDKWEPLPNTLPYGPWTNVQMFQFYNAHLVGAPPPIGTKLTVDVPKTAIKGEPMSISAILKDERGTPIEGVYIDFFIGGVSAGSRQTDSKGVAKFNWVMVNPGSFEIKGIFTGSLNYQKAESEAVTIKIEAPQPTPTPPPLPPPQPDYTMYYLAAAVIIIIVGALLYRRTRS